MIRFLGICFALLLGIVTPAMLLDHFSGSLFLDDFMEKRSLLLMGTILSIFTVTSASFLAILFNYEQNAQQKIFDGTTSEIKENFTLILIIFAVHFLLLSGTPPEGTCNYWLIKILLGLKVFTFSIYIYALYELSMALFGIREKLDI